MIAKRRTTLLLVPDGVSARNFVLSGLPTRLAADGDRVDILTTSHLAGHVERLAIDVDDVGVLAAYHERPAEALSRRLMEYAHMRAQDYVGMRYMLGLPVPGRPAVKALRLGARAASRLFATPARVDLLDRAHAALARRRSEVDHHERTLAARPPDVILCAHQRPLEVLPLVIAARRLGIPTVTFIFSWDNLTSKARIPSPFDHFFVWSDLMEQEMRDIYPDVAASRIHVVGSPQFELAADEAMVWSRERFLDELGLDADRPIICYSGSDQLTGPDDPHHLRILCELVADGRIPGNPQVVLRPAPADESDRYRPVLDAHPVTLSRPRWLTGSGGWASAMPTPEDLELLVNLTVHTAVNVNLTSTMSLDFALKDKPVVNLGFDVEATPGTASKQHAFDHYRPVIELGAVRVAHDADELARHVTAYLEDPTLDRQGRRRFVERLLRVEPGASLDAIAAALDRVIAG